jgi:serine/threonine-protein kinase
MDLSDVWLDQPCAHPDWCAAADLDLNGKVDLSDFALLGERWLEGTVAVPNVVVMSQTEAQTAIISQELTVGEVSQMYSDTVAAGTVISQNPLGGVFIRPGGIVDLVISQGPEPFLMPYFIGMTLAEAEAVILDEGLLLESFHEHNDYFPEGYVFDQLPFEGEPVFPGDTVYLTVSLGFMGPIESIPQ